MNVISTWLAATAGAIIGFTAAALLAASGDKPLTKPQPVDVKTCLECDASRWEAHNGDAELVCWKSPAEGGRVVRPSSWCGDWR